MREKDFPALKDGKVRGGLCEEERVFSEAWAAEERKPHSILIWKPVGRIQALKLDLEPADQLETSKLEMSQPELQFTLFTTKRCRHAVAST